MYHLFVYVLESDYYVLVIIIHAQRTERSECSPSLVGFLQLYVFMFFFLFIPIPAGVSKYNWYYCLSCWMYLF